jgi:hypothetical protein
MTKKALVLLALLPLPFANGGAAVPLSAEQTTSDTACQEAVERIDLNTDLSHLVSSFRLPSKGLYGVRFSWTSSNAAIEISDDAVDGYPLAQVSPDENGAISGAITVTAFLSDHVNATKDFACTVLPDSGSASTPLPVHWEEDFSAYETGIELANYDKWQCSSLEGGEATVVSALKTNVNEMASSKVLACESVRSSSDLTYKRQANVTASENQNGAVIEGDLLYTGTTNGLAIEAINSAGQVISGFQLSSSGYALNEGGTYVNGSALTPTEGVWEHFRLSYLPNVGRSSLSVYDWLSASWVEPLKGNKNYDRNGYLIGQGVGNVTALRISLGKGSLFGTTYVANLKMDNLAAFPLKTPANPNRSLGIGTISNYQDVLFAFEGEGISGLNPSFQVQNRFDPSVSFVSGTDYTVASSHSTEEDCTLYQYLFTLLKTGETKTVSQRVYTSKRTDAPTIADFRGSYLKKNSDATGYIEGSGKIIRGDITLHYAPLKAGASAPTKEQIRLGTAENCLAYDALALTTHEFTFQTASVPLDGEYDLYGYASTDNGESEIYLSKSLSTIVNIETPEDFHAMSSDLTTLGSTFRLLNDIDFSTYYWAFDEASRSFTGTLDGNGHTIKNLTISNANGDKAIKTGLFFNFNGTIENLTFDHCVSEGFADVGLLGGNAYGCTVRNCSFIDCRSSLEATLAGGDGYFGLLIGRCRGKDNLFENIDVQGAEISGNQRLGLLVGGTEASTYDVNVSFKNVVAEGSIDEPGGAQAGLMGRNYSKSKTSTLSVENAFIDLTVLSAKKEVGTVLGRNEGGSKVVAKNIYGDLKIKALDQSGYFGEFIGYDVSATGSSASFAFQGENLAFVDNDYSALGDAIVQNKNAVNGGKRIALTEERDQKYYETSSWLKDFDTSLIFAYDQTLQKPIISVKTALNLSAKDFENWVSQLDENDLPSCHYALYKAGDVLAVLSPEEKAKISAASSADYERIKSAYEALLASLGQSRDF